MNLLIVYDFIHILSLNLVDIKSFQTQIIWASVTTSIDIPGISLMCLGEVLLFEYLWHGT